MDLDLIFVEQFNLYKKEFSNIILNSTLKDNEKICNPQLTPLGTRYANLFAILKVASIYGDGDLLENIQQALNKYNFQMPRTLIYLDILLFATFHFCHGTQKETNTEIMLQKTIQKHENIFQNLNCEFNMFYVWERIDCRFDFWKLGWSMSSAERFIQKYFTTINEVNIVEEVDEHTENLISIMAQMLSIQREKIEKKKGRPILPHVIKELSKKQNANLVKINNRKKYQKASMFECIEKNLLTEEEFNLIKNKVDDQNVLEKLKNLVLR